MISSSVFVFSEYNNYIRRKKIMGGLLNSIVEYYENEEILKADGFDDAVIGIMLKPKKGEDDGN